MRVFEPEDQWDRHPKPWWRDVLTEARGRGWRLKRYSDHSWGGIFCPANECKISPIFSTANGSESFAKTAMRRVKRCPHRPEPPQESLAEVTDRLEEGERFATAAEALLARDASEAEAAELVELAEQSVDCLRDLDWEFDRATRAAEEQATTAWTALAGTPLGDVEDAEPVVAEADRQADLAGTALGEIDDLSQHKRALTSRYAELRADIDRLKVQVGLTPSDRKEE